jgi:hypothetical protein
MGGHKALALLTVNLIERNIMANLNTTETPEQELARLRAENAQLQQTVASNKHKAPKPTLRVSEKGAVSIYGLQRFPVTLYKEQMLTVLDMGAEIQAFIKANDSKLTTK